MILRKPFKIRTHIGKQSKEWKYSNIRVDPVLRKCPVIFDVKYLHFFYRAMAVSFGFKNFKKNNDSLSIQIQ